MLKSTATLKERLAGWVDWDGASWHVGVCLGFWPDFGAPPGEDPWFGHKGTIWSNNPLGNAIAELIHGLVAEGMLEENNEQQFRWNPEYKGLDR